MADTAKRLSGPTALTGSAATQYTAPGSTTAILHNIHVANEDATTAYTFTLSIGTDGAGKRLFAAVSVPAAGVYDWAGFIVLATTEVVQALASTTNKLTLTISGVEVT